jgi:hypothetical protein
MITTLWTDKTVRDVIEGFEYNELEGKGLFGLDGKLTIQPEFQRNYIYAEEGKEAAVIDSLLREYPLGLLYFNKSGDDQYEVLDGQQRITSIGRFVYGKFAVSDSNGMQQYFSGLAQTLQERILKAPLLVYVCEGEEPEIKDWFRTINIAGVQLKPQEILNAVYSGPFVTMAKAEFSNSQNSNTNKWAAYISGNVKRQDYLETALKWVSDNHIDEYMSQHRFDDNIAELKNYFNSVIDWVSNTFTMVEKEMQGLDWGKLYVSYHEQTYSSEEISLQIKKLYGDEFVKNRKGIFEYVLGGGEKKNLLDIRFFEDSVNRVAYERQTAAAKENGVSNCSYCAMGHEANKTKIWLLSEMDADHVSAWSKGGATAAENCEMLCKPHNRAKGNR